MSDRRDAIPRILIVLSLAAMAATLGWLRSVSAEYALFADFLADGKLVWSLDAAASITTALLVVVLVEEVVVRLMLAICGVQPTGFQRAGLYAVLGTAAGTVVLTHLGVNITAVFATSAILTAVLGLALQPALGGLIAGLTLHTDRELRIGDAIMQDGEPVQVMAFNWRSVSGRKLDGSLVVIPNAHVVDRTIEILPRDRSVRADTVFPAPITTAPQRLCDLVGDLVADFPEVDDSQPIVVAPVAFDPDKALTRYRIRYWIHAYADRSDIDSEVLRRVWYALQREDVAWPVNSFYGSELRIPQGPAALLARDWPETVTAALAQAPPHPALAGLPAGFALATAVAGVPLFYAASERIVLPPRVRGSVCLLIQGEVRETASEFDTLAMAGQLAVARLPDRGVERLSRRITVKRISDRLAEYIGPYAEIVVRRAADELTDLAKIGQRVSDEIADPTLRRAFLADIITPEERRHGPGMIFRLRRDAVGNLVSDPLLRAVKACALVAIPLEALAAHAP